MERELTTHEKRELRKKERVNEKRRERIERKRKERIRRVVGWGAVIFGIVIISYLLFGFFSSQKKPEITYSREDENAPRIQVKPEYYDFGEVSVGKGTVTALLTIKNVGENDLIIDNMETSCMCTEVSLIVDGKESPKFGMTMHGNPVNWWQNLTSGEEAQLKIYYNPRVHSELRGSLTRIITIYSNDPWNSKKEVRIGAYQIS